MTSIAQLPFPFKPGLPGLPGLPGGGNQTPKSGIARLLNPLTNQIGQFYDNAAEQDIVERLTGYTDQVEQITSTTFPEFKPNDIMGGIGGLPFARVGLPMNDNPMMDGVMKELYNPQDPQVDFGAPSYSTIDYSTKPAVTPPGNPLADAFGLGQTVTNGIGSLFGR